MRPFRFLHTADLHLGTPFHGIGGSMPDAWLQRLRQASFEVFSRIVEIAICEQVDFVTIAGDLFDADEVPMAVQFELLRGFERLGDHGISVFACHGNHDPLRNTSAIRWPDCVHIFPSIPAVVSDDYRAPSTMLDIDADTRIQISGFSYHSAELYRSMAEAFERDPRATFSIALYHGVVGSSAGHANYAATTLDALKVRGFDFWGLGHIHQPLTLSDANPTVVYPGNPQGRHARETGTRGVLLVDVDERGEVYVHPERTSIVEWEEVTVNVDGCESLDAVRSVLLNDLTKMHAEDATVSFVTRVTLVGQTSVHVALQDSDAFLEGIHDDLTYQRIPVWVERLGVHTHPVLDVDALQNSDAFIGEFLRLVAGFQGDIGAARETLLPLLRDVFHARNELPAEALTDDEIDSLLEDVVRLVLAELTVEGSQG